MKRILTLLITISCCTFYTELCAQHDTVSFTRSSNVLSGAQQPVKLISFKGSINKNKVFLQWIIEENKNADQFIIEKSIDGKNFVMAALVFSSEKTETDNYEFYERANNKKVSYRIKLIDKNQETAYSPVIEVDPTIKFFK
jgi:hypothetical protein